MGSLLLAAGQKGLRFALPNARILVHQPKGGFEGQVTDIMLHAQEILNLKKRLGLVDKVIDHRPEIPPLAVVS